MNKLNLIKKIKNRKQTPDSLKDLFELMKSLDEPNVELAHWIRKEAINLTTKHKDNAKDLYELVFYTYLYAGKYSFDDYMIACEWNRPKQAKFFAPRRKVLEGKHKIVSQIQDFINDDHTRYLGISMPPGTGKTTLIKFLLAYIAGKYPQSMSMYVSYADAIVKMVFDAVSAILTDTNQYLHNEIFRNNEPDISAEYKTISYRNKGDAPTLGCVSISGTVTGRTRANKFLVTDDLVKSDQEARSPERLDNLYKDYTTTIATRIIGDDVKQIQLGTPWSTYDPLNRMARKHNGDPRYKFIRIPVEDEETGESNFEYECSERYTKESIQRLKQEHQRETYSALYMMKPMDKAGLAFPEEDLKYFTGTLPDGEPDNIAFACDVAWGGGDDLCMPIIYLYGTEGYIADVVFDNGDKFQTKPRVVGKILQHNIKMGRFEANNGGDEYADDINKILREKYNYHCRITHKKASNQMAKAVRIEQYTPDIKELYFIAPKYQSDEYRRFMSSLTSFSFTTKNKHDDAADAMAMLVEYIFSGLKKVSVAKRII